MNLSIYGLGTATPARSIEQVDAAELAKSFIYDHGKQLSLLPKLYRRTLVQRRNSVLLEPSNGHGQRLSFYATAIGPDDRGPSTELRMRRFAAEATPLAVAASRKALRLAKLVAGDITHLITVSCTGFHSPGVDIALIKQLGLPPTVGRVNVGFMGCHGAFNGLRTALAFGQADPQARVLMACVELCSLHYQYGWDAEQIVANALFADGAASVVAGPSTDNDAGRWRLAACGSYVLPDAEDEMTWQIGDHGFRMTLSARVPSLVGQHLRPWLEDWLNGEGLTVADVGSWAVHPGGPRIVHSVAEALNLPGQATEHSAQVLAEFGNMSSATVLFVLERLQRCAAPLPCVALAFGPGLVAEAALFV